MSPTVFRQGRFRGFFFSREEPRVHVHVECSDGEAKFWLEPVIALASHSPGLSRRNIVHMQTIVVERAEEIVKAWKKHFG